VVEFNGSDSYIQTEFPGIGGADDRSVTFWVKTTDLNTHGIVAWGDAGANGRKWHLRVNNDEGNGPLGAIRTEVQGGFNIGTTNIADGEWHHVASVFANDGSPDVADVLHYVDGVLEERGGFVDEPIDTDISELATLVTIGRRTQGAAQDYFGGLIADVQIYDKALSAAEVAALVPEPSGFLLALLALGGLWGLRRQRA
jgi:MYXO-CTERM domain-containing protein